MSMPEFVQFHDVSAGSSGGTHPIEAWMQQLSEDGNPFTFTPQILHLHKDHELFEGYKFWHYLGTCTPVPDEVRLVKYHDCCFQDGDIQRHLYLRDLYISETEEKTTLSVSEFACHIFGCHARFNLLQEYEHHYNSLHRNMCSSCRRCFPSARLLDIHIQEWHDSLFAVLAQKQDMYLCLVEGCELKFRTAKQRKDHLIRIHKYPPDFRFDKPKKERGNKDRRGQEQKVIEPIDDVCQSEGVCEDICNPMSDQPEKEESMEVCEKEAAHMEDMPTPVQDSEVNTPTSKPQSSYRIPKSVCFGHGSSRGFRGQRGRRK